MPSFFDQNGIQPAGPTTDLSVSSATANVILPGSNGSIYYPLKVALTAITASGSPKAVWVTFGGSSVTASTATSMPLPSNGLYILRVPQGATYISAICDTGTANLYITNINGGLN